MMPSTSPRLPSLRIRRFVVGLFLLAVPACGLSSYEGLMYKAQENEKRYREEQAYLDKPLDMPTRKVQTENDKEPREELLANMFLRPPKGIDSKPQSRTDLIWQYRVRSAGFDFSAVELAFADPDDQNFADKVMISYEATTQATRGTYQFTPPGQETPTIFDTWDFANGPTGCSVNILRSNRSVAIVYLYNKARHDSARKAIELSLQSLALDQQSVTARQRYSNQKTPWKLASK